MDKYIVKLYARAYWDLDEIYTYIAGSLLEPATASKIIDELENTIFSLAYANQGYRQLFYKNYTIIYRVLKEKKEVHIVTVRYTPSNF